MQHLFIFPHLLKCYW